MEGYHVPVLINEVLEYLHIEKGKKYIDATLGDGGHTIEILKLGGHVLGLDYSPLSLENAVQRIKTLNLAASFTPVLGNFAHIYTLAKDYDFSDVSGILFDLGYSSTQLETEGMSFLQDQPLDMRIDKSLGVTAKDLVNALSEPELARLFQDFGEERLARRFAKAIVDYRRLKKLETTTQLADLIKASAPLSYDNQRIHPATRAFMALRIAVNNELENLRDALPRAAQLIMESKLPAGRIGVISFHSLEDFIVKSFGKTVQPVIKELTRKPIVPTLAETKANSRARSAKLRVFEKLL
jgi:16S rRNA (cytosine1402-N4)-methyltransferase